MFKIVFPIDFNKRQGNKSSNCFSQLRPNYFHTQNLQTGADVTVNLMNAPNQSTLQVQDNQILIICIIHENKCCNKSRYFFFPKHILR